VTYAENEEEGYILTNNGSKIWMLNGQRHRVSGPAVETAGSFKAWWYKGQYVPVQSQEEFERWLKMQAFW
jgi:hypothetical protein